MKVLFFVIISLAVAISSGCASKEKAEYQREVDAVPMPKTEVERILQCEHFNSRAFFVYLESYRKQQKQIIPNIFDHPEEPFFNRMYAMKCSQLSQMIAPS